jgi:hypothetical protein
MAESASSCSSPPPVFSPLPLNSRLSHRTFSYEYENGGSEAMQKDALKHVENIVYERYILDLKGMHANNQILFYAMPPGIISFEYLMFTKSTPKELYLLM